MSLYQTTFIRSSNKFAAARCSRCHRPLTDPDSIRAGIGPECRARSGSNLNSDLCNRDQFSDEFDNSIPFEQALVLKRRLDRRGDALERGVVITNVPHLVVHHSPDGYEFSYSGSGPTDLALNCCQLYLNMVDYEGQQTKCYDGKCWSLAWALRRDFRDAFLGSVPREGTVIPFAKIDAWFKSKLVSTLIDQFSIQTEQE